MLTYKNILIAVDGSHEAEWAFNKALDVAKRNDAQLSIQELTLLMKCTMLNSQKNLKVFLMNF